jgi:hypothetical protein
MVIYTFSAFVTVICHLLGFYTAYVGSSVPKYSSIFKGQAVDCFYCLTLADGTDRLPQNFGMGLPFYTA